MTAILLTSRLAVAGEVIDFNRDVRPILSANCFKCHGPDPETRAVELRLDTREGLFADRGGYAAFVPNDVEASEALRRMASDDEFEQMPPPDAKMSLSPREIAVIRAWVEQGANWEPHWAFVAPARHDPPPVSDVVWPRNPIDRFVLARLEADGFEPSDEADSYALVRRLSLDLIGLPPTPEQADAFVNDSSPDAYERLVDRLLASPHYGERWARRWLDLARYADTNGYEKDRPRTIWPYRDWVVDAINAGMPFDEFTVRQLAGDLLPGATLDDRIATGFHRNTMLNEEGGIDPLEFRYHAMADRVATTGTTWLGLTTGCAQCHDHKYDPISHREYFGLMAFLNNADEPELPLPDPAREAAYARDLAEADRLLAELPSRWPADDAARPQIIERRFAEWLDRERDRTVEWTTLQPMKATSNLPLLTIEDDGVVFSSGDTTKQDTYELTLSRRAESGERRANARGVESPLSRGRGAGGEGRASTSVAPASPRDEAQAAIEAAGNPLTPNSFPQREGDRRSSPSRTSDEGSSAHGEPHAITAIRLEALPDDRLPAGGPGMTYYEGRKGDFFLAEFRLSHDGAPVPIASATHSYANNQFGTNPATAPMAIDGDLQTGWSTNGRPAERHTAVFVLKEPLEVESLNLTMIFGRHFASSLGKFRLSYTSAPDAEARDFSLDVERMLAKADAELTDDERNRLRQEFLLRASELAEHAEEIRKLRTPPESLTTLVFRERPPENPRPTFIHNRGEFLQPTDEVGPLTIDALHPFPDDLPKNRLGLAKWIVARENPLTARVVVNRHWAALFGRGLVPTVQDFGFQGETPSHPQLLDWLAVEFMDSGWDVKHLHRLIVTSATYRQESGVRRQETEGDGDAGRDESSIDDPANILLSRGPRLRLEAELIRDAALAVSGLLAPKLGGPPVRPPQPVGVTEAAYGSPTWTADTGEDRYRRSLYTFVKRTAPFAMYSVFDAPSGEACTAERDVSNTAMQSLTLLNDEMFLEAARAFGDDLAAREGSDVEKATHAFRRVLTRPPDETETARLVEFVDTQRTRFASGEIDAKAFIGDSDDSVEKATWTALARALLSLDEAITRN